MKRILSIIASIIVVTGIVIVAQEPTAQQMQTAMQQLAQQLNEKNETVAALQSRAAAQTVQIQQLQATQQAILAALDAAGKTLTQGPDGKLVLTDKPTEVKK